MQKSGFIFLYNHESGITKTDERGILSSVYEKFLIFRHCEDFPNKKSVVIQKEKNKKRSQVSGHLPVPIVIPNELKKQNRVLRYLSVPIGSLDAQNPVLVF